MIKFIKIIFLVILNFYLLFSYSVKATETIKIGLMVPLTGSNNELGQSIIKAVRLALKDINNNSIEIIPKDTASKAFRDLQAKGFIVVKKGASLGVEGHGKCPEYEITFITTLHKEASKLYLDWSEDEDFPIFAHPVKNPTGKSKPCHNKYLKAS